MKTAFLVAIAAWGFASYLSGAGLVPGTDGMTVYDSVHNITWLVDANLAAGNRFTLPVCNAVIAQPCVNPSGSMGYPSAAAWVKAMNAANYLGHSDWQIPTTPSADSGCPFVGTNGNSFGFGCMKGALGSLYYNALGLLAPNSAVPAATGTIGPFSNFQPYLYWSQTPGEASSSGYGTFSFNSGFQGANTKPNYLYALPMLPGKIAGTPAATGKGLQVNPGGQTVYDPVSNVTWLANANLAATNSMGLPACKGPGTPKPCAGLDGAMDWDSATQFVTNMNAGAGYLGQTSWQLPPLDQTCGAGYDCSTPTDPLGELFYGQLGLSAGTPAATPPDTAVGPFRHFQPYLYWSCQAAAIQSPCDSTGPSPQFEWTFSFGNGFLGTDLFQNEFYVIPYFVGQAVTTTGPVIAEVSNAAGESPTIAPNTWLEIRGTQLAPAGDTRVWQGSDFTGNQMPTQLDHVSVTVNGKSAFVYYISATQINVLTPPDAMSGAVQVVVTNNGVVGAAFTAQSQAISPSFFLFNGGPYAAATHVNGSLLGPANLYPGSTTPAKPGETIVIYATGFGATTTAVVSGAATQSGGLATLPVIKIGGTAAVVQFGGLVSPGEFQFNVVVPPSIADGDQTITAAYNGQITAAGTLITIQR